MHAEPAQARTQRLTGCRLTPSHAANGLLTRAEEKKQRAQSFPRGAKGDFATPWPRSWSVRSVAGRSCGGVLIWQCPDMEPRSRFWSVGIGWGPQGAVLHGDITDRLRRFSPGRRCCDDRDGVRF
ncbi:hypothetical protein BGZ61DRAFT_28425 [Ilyonectria robusta]|uniref:uncharacterized protein n=1 Tax=Ilyonectria robusta TaxID=1079257 RepID=UPI001E8DA707|nr:uncharacterized protein BGZ61DRAFT_28425 [Ilyonectria robusta]KAH8738135.1 hypothetical protein BGZ61DRAFT_28425 [Ilyonectria robusta]